MKPIREDMKAVLASLPESYQADREELLSLLLNRGILYRTPEQPICSPDGRQGRWMLNSLAVTLEQRGAELAARCLLPLLERFDGRQLATYGLIGVPILQACIMLSGGRYRGLLVRKEAKAHGAMRIIEGEIDPKEPVILIDDSIVSGRTFWEGCRRLEEAGLRVEGGAFLVRFGWPYGVSDARERGFHIESVYDIFEDFMANMEGEEKPVYNPSKVFPETPWSEVRAPEGLHPAHLARFALVEYLRTGMLPRPPERMDNEYNAAGGAWVSLRAKNNIHERHARDGFWNFPGESQCAAPEAVVRAALLTANKLPQGEERLSIVETSHIAVTFFSALEECTVGEIDNDRHGVVVGSRERPGVMGGALPRMPGFGSDYRLFEHARITNGKLLPWEPYVIHRHDVMKFVEPGAPWQPTGVPAPEQPFPWQDPAVCEPIAQRARDLALHEALGTPESMQPLTPEMLPPDLDLAFVTIYLWGQLRGCSGLPIHDLDDDLRRLIQSALADNRFKDIDAESPEAIAVSVSFLHKGVKLADCPPQEIWRYVVNGRQALHVSQGNRSGIVLPFWAAMHSLLPEEYAMEVVDKAGITRPPYYWERFHCATWLADAGGVGRLEGAFRPLPPPEEDAELARQLTELYVNYMLRHHREDGSFYSSYEPFRNRLHNAGTPPRLAFGGWVMARAARMLEAPELQTARDRTLELLLSSIRLGEQGLWLEIDQNTPSVSEIAFLTLALCELPQGDYRRVHARGLADALWASIDAHGYVGTHFTQEQVEESFQDYFPGQVLLALAAAVREGLSTVDETRLERAFRYYRHRFRYKRNFGQVIWLMRAFSAWWHLQHDPEFAGMVFEVGDWILQHQQEKSGAFISDDQPDLPGYTSALYLEGIGAALPVAEAVDASRFEQYRSAYLRGLRFLHRITILPGHAPVLPNSELAVGGLRMGLDTSFVRIDFVQHGLSTVLEYFSQPEAGASRKSSLNEMESTAV
jgi:AMMECR1 domain-containing protein/orotate phosphoribosyltransferase